MVDNKEARLTALTKLALRTREKVEPATFVLYVEDTAKFSTAVVVEACDRWGRSQAWFPKAAELIEECRLVAQRHEERREQRQLSAHSEPASPERLAKFLDDVKALARQKAMR